jgi:hypothetical protein
MYVCMKFESIAIEPTPPMFRPGKEKGGCAQTYTTAFAFNEPA